MDDKLMWKVTKNKDSKTLLFVPTLEIWRWSDCLIMASFHGVLAYNILYSKWNPSYQQMVSNWAVADITKSIAVCIWEERLNLSSMAVFKGFDHEITINVIVSITKTILSISAKLILVVWPVFVVFY